MCASCPFPIKDNMLIRHLESAFPSSASVFFTKLHWPLLSMSSARITQKTGYRQMLPHGARSRRSCRNASACSLHKVTVEKATIEVAALLKRNYVQYFHRCCCCDGKILCYGANEAPCSPHIASGGCILCLCAVFIFAVIWKGIWENNLAQTSLWVFTTLICTAKSLVGLDLQTQLVTKTAKEQPNYIVPL